MCYGVISGHKNITITINFEGGLFSGEYDHCIILACDICSFHNVTPIYTILQARKTLENECKDLRRELLEKKIACTRTKRQPVSTQS